MKTSNSLSPFERLVKIVRSERDDILLLIYLTLGYGFLSIATPIAVQALVNNVTMGGVIQPLIVISLILFFLLVISGLLYVLEEYVVEFIQRRLFVNTAIQVAKNTQGATAEVYDKTNPVELVNRFFDITTIQKSAATLLTVGLIATIQGLIGSLILIFYSFYFAIIVVIVLLFFWFIVNVLGKQATNTAIAESKAKYATAAWLETIAGNFYLFKFYNGLHHAQARTETLTSTYLDKRASHFHHLFWQNLSGVMFYAFVGTTMLAMGGILVVNGQINLGQFVAAELIFFGILAAFLRVLSKLEDYYDILAAVDKVGVLNDLPQEKSKTDQATPTALTTLSVSELAFAYSPRVQPIQNINFELAKGGSLAIMGLSGTGKSTIVNLITALRSPDKGFIEYDGIDLRQINRQSLRNCIGIATKVEIFEGSILDNIRLYDDSITLHEINDVLEALGLLDELSLFEHGLNTQLTSFGAPLSTTQLQRLMLVRAIVTKPHFLIIDGMIDGLSMSQTDTVIHYLHSRKSEWMLIVTTRLEHVAKQFNQQLLLIEQQEA